jgi:hypothetical protein
MVCADANANADDGWMFLWDSNKIPLPLHLLAVERKAPCDDDEKKSNVAMADWKSGDCFFIPLASDGIALFIFRWSYSMITAED